MKTKKARARGTYDFELAKTLIVAQEHRGVEGNGYSLFLPRGAGSVRGKKKCGKGEEL